ncbi:MAG: hypothetical protein A2309_03325 [Bacteroidetes bacterium RIFOXYB2_FULL_35_7]|nr:MAG: hypothetical protein A2X01_14710 [Bacteroidetes bacterium GWF2_35_48]OFY97666.1 MAG: hypothetical protein A2309_03325 [Bacteroidetes bacterium RIFOXYB2_FULL_35_7]OFZ01035.1 MAG: hypothetical protein A2491_17615 [Bacteroidetes bacterium RIFOXYC12_FULL_35_7]HBX53563.1 hypothetical protein [Bacteroidales bacterium]
MAIVQNPVTGRTRKKFGSAVFSKQFGKNTMRTKPVEVRNPKTVPQKQQRTKFSLMVALARLIMGFIRVSFKQAATSMSAFNVFVKSNISTAITGAYPNYTVNFPNLIISKGTLTGADSGSAVAAAGKKVTISWLDNSGNGDAQTTDKAMMLIINNTKKAIVQDMINKTRVDLTSQFIVPASWVGDQVHAYLSFKTPAGDKVADSVFLATVTVLA